MAPSTNSPHNRPCCSALRDGSGNAQLHVGSSENALTRIATTSSRSCGDATRGLRSSAAMDSTPRLGVSPAGPTGAKAASVELHSPARETHTGMCLLNEVSDNVVGTVGNQPNKAPAHREIR